MAIGDRLKHAWNAFSNPTRDLGQHGSGEYYGWGGRPDRQQMIISNERSIISSIYTRMGIDVAGIDIRHARVDEHERYLEDIDSGLNYCLTQEANIDQAPRAFRQDIAMTLFDKGVAAIVPVDTTVSPLSSGGWDIKNMRVGDIIGWYPDRVRVNLYNEEKGFREQVIVPKKMVAIVENPLYSVMNEPNSTLQRLMRKLALLDTNDELVASGKLDLIIQLPYVIKSEARRQQAEQRRKDIEFQLKGSQYGIAYTDGTEKVQQLNRPAENNLLAQVEYLTKLLYVQLGLTEEVMNGTADEKTMLNYFNRTIDPVCDAITEAMARSFLTRTARTQGQRVLYFRDQFKLIPIGGEHGLAEVADKLARNEIATSNELRQVIGWKPSDEPKADKLINSNMPVGDTGVEPGTEGGDGGLNAELDNVEAELDEALAGG